MDFSLVAPRGNKRKPKKVKIYLDTVWFTLPLNPEFVAGNFYIHFTTTS